MRQYSVNIDPNASSADVLSCPCQAPNLSSCLVEFQSDGPATEKARGPSVLSRHRGTTKKRRVADRRCCRAETSDTGIRISVTYGGAWPCR